MQCRRSCKPYLISENEFATNGLEYKRSIRNGTAACVLSEWWKCTGAGKVSEKRVHPTQKPVKLLEKLLLAYSNKGDTVLDNCMGSGSTGVACVNLNRNFIGMELKQEYFDIANERINNAIFKKKEDNA